MVLWCAIIVYAPLKPSAASCGFYEEVPGLLFVDFETHMEMQINVVVPKQNRTKNYAEELGRKEKVTYMGSFYTKRWLCSLLVGLLVDINLDRGTSAEVPSLEVSLSSS